jgi:hypothetical protein
VTCTITNDDDAPALTLKKTVTNNSGGTAKANAWTLNAGSLINEAGSCTDDGSVCSMALTTKTSATAGTGYALSETGGPSNYTAGSWSCDGGSLVASTITLGLGDDVTCTITNDDDAPALTLKKTVVNDNGGTAKANAWTLNAGSLINEAGACTDDGSVCSMALTTKTTATAGTGYALSETGGPSDYTASSWSCDGGSLVGSTITLALGDDVTCTITNDDPVPPADCEAGDRLTSVSLQLTANSPNPITIGVTDDNGPSPTLLSSSPGSITTGTTFTIVPDAGTFFDSQNLRFFLNGELSKDLKVHLSCSDDPMVGDTHSGTADGASATLTKTAFTPTQF